MGMSRHEMSVEATAGCHIEEIVRNLRAAGSTDTDDVLRARAETVFAAALQNLEKISGRRVVAPKCKGCDVHPPEKSG